MKKIFFYPPELYFNSIRKTKKSKVRREKSSKNATFPGGSHASLYTLSSPPGKTVYSLQSLFSFAQALSKWPPHFIYSIFFQMLVNGL